MREIDEAFEHAVASTEDKFCDPKRRPDKIIEAEATLLKKKVATAIEMLPEELWDMTLRDLYEEIA